ncbi:MAG: purine-nucleoside phosphorylase, partial [Paracoccaceae bacterium]|nr:purine-nucleoside phosphorylase [Paracoccaceae bacterium]
MAASELADLIRERAGAAPVRLGLILGSGLGHLAATVE